MSKYKKSENRTFINKVSDCVDELIGRMNLLEKEKHDTELDTARHILRLTTEIDKLKEKIEFESKQSKATRYIVVNNKHEIDKLKDPDILLKGTLDSLQNQINELFDILPRIKLDSNKPCKEYGCNGCEFTKDDLKRIEHWYSWYSAPKNKFDDMLHFKTLDLLKQGEWKKDKNTD